MKYLTKTSMFSAAALIAALPILVAVHLVSASGTATLYLSPASQSLAPGDTLDVAIHEDSGSDSVNAVQANLTYPSSLTFVSITPNTSAWPIQAENTGGGGTVRIGRGTTTPVTGDQVIATVRFTASKAGTAAINFDAGSAVVRSVGNTAEALTETGGTYTISSSASMSLSPASKTVSQGASFDVGVYEDSGTTAVNAVQANLSYPGNILTFVKVDTSGSAFTTTAQATGGNGSVKIALGTCGGCAPATNLKLVAVVTFKAANPGTASVAIDNDSGIISASDNTALASTNTGAVYIVISSGTSSPPPSGGSTGGTTTKKSTSAPAPPKTYTSSSSDNTSPVTSSADTTGPTISNIQATNLTQNSATINWQTSEPATSEVDYGLSTNFILSSGDSSLATNHSIKLDPKELIGHKTYHFIVKSTDAAGNQSVSKDMTFSTGGIQITATEIAAAAGAAVLGGGIWVAAAGGLKLGGGMAASAGGIYKEPKPIIVGGGAPPPPPPPVVQPQTIQKPAAAPSQEPQAPGKVVGPKTPSAPQAENQTLPKWVKK